MKILIGLVAALLLVLTGLTLIGAYSVNDRCEP